MARNRFDYLGDEEDPRRALGNRFFAHIVVLVIAIILFIGVSVTLANTLGNDDTIASETTTISTVQTT